MKKINLSIFFLFLIVFSASSQADMRNLEDKLKTAQGKEKFEILYNISKLNLSISAKKSLEYGNQAFQMAKQLNDLNLEANSLNLIGTAFYQLQKYKDAVKSYEEEFKIRKDLNQVEESIKTLYNIGAMYESWGKESKALNSYMEALKLAKSGNLESLSFQCYESVINIYKEEKKYKEAYEYMSEYLSFRSASDIAFEKKKISILETRISEEKKSTEQTRQQLARVDSNLTIIKGEKETLVQDTAIKSKEILVRGKTINEQKEENRRQRQWLIMFIAFFIVILVFSIILYLQVQAKKKANRLLIERNAQIIEQKEEILVQAELLLDQNAHIEEANEEIQTQAEHLELVNKELRYRHDQITDSIRYACRIQTVMLPPKTYIDQIIKENMVLFKPRDIVSGDFYWVKKIKHFVIFAAADCTGHGVPGAFMSMLGMSFLDDIVSEYNIKKPNEILNTLRERIKTSLNQTGRELESGDGMDIALCILNTECNSLQYSGAYNPLYLIRDNQLQVFKADKQPVAIHIKEHDFTNHEIELHGGDCLYIFSDGYVDQFGGENDQKFKSKRFNQLLLDIHQKPMQEQAQILNKTIIDWMGKKHDQLDDILIMGLRIEQG